MVSKSILSVMATPVEYDDVGAAPGTFFPAPEPSEGTVDFDSVLT
jgi:hypothetical protein